MSNQTQVRSRVVLYPDTASVSPPPLGSEVPPPSPVAARVTTWAPGLIRIALEGAAEVPQYLVVSENWYPDWHASVDGQEVPVLRGQYALLSVVVPPGAREVELVFRSAAYARGRLITLVGLAGIGVLFAVPLIRRRRGSRG